MSLETISSRDRERFERLWLDARPRLYASLRRKIPDVLRSEDRYQDVLQETAIRALRGFHTWKQESSFHTWIHRIGINAAFDLNKRHVRKEGRSVSLDAPFGDLDARTYADELQDGDLDIQGDAERKETLSILQEAMGRLIPDQAIILQLCCAEEMGYEEVSELLGIPMGTVKSRLHRAREFVAKHFEDIQRERMAPTTSTPAPKLMDSLDFTKTPLQDLPEIVGKKYDAIVTRVLHETQCVLTLAQVRALLEEKPQPKKKTPGPAKPKGEKTTPEQREQMRTLARQGLTNEEISIRLGIAKNVVHGATLHVRTLMAQDPGN